MLEIELSSDQPRRIVLRVIGTDANVEVEPQVSHKSLAVSGPSVVGVPSVPRTRNGGFLKRSTEFALEFSEALTFAIGALGLQLANAFNPEGPPTWRSAKWNHHRHLPQEQHFSHVYGYICAPPSWGAPEISVSCPQPGA
eukprot:3617717-Pyramimonas_sp.AAC.1